MNDTHGNINVTLKSREKELADASIRYASVQADFGKLNGDKAKLELTIQDLQKEVADLRLKLKATDDEHGKTKTTFASLQGDHGSKLTEIATLTAGAAAAAVAIKSKDDELGKMKIRLGELEASLKTKDADLAGWNTKFTTLQGDFNTTKTGSTKLDADLKAALGARADLEAKLKARDAEVAKLTADWDAKLKLKSGEVATLTAGATVAGASIKAKDDEIGKLRLDWEGKLKARDAEIAKLNLDWDAKLKAAADEAAKVKAEAELHKNNHGRSLAEIATLTAGAAATGVAVKGKEDEIGKLKSRIGELEAGMKTKDADLSGWNTKFMSLQGDFDKFKVTAKGSDDELAKMRARIAGLETDLDKVNYTRGTYEASLKSRDQHVADLQAELAKLRAADAAKSTQITTFMSSANSAGDAIKTREKELADANARYAEMDRNLGSMKARLGELEGALGGKDKEANDLRWRIGELEAELGKARGTTSDYEARIAGTDKGLNDAKWRIGELEAELASLRGAKGDVEAELVALRARPVPVALAPVAPVTLKSADKGFADEAASKAGVTVVRTECPQHLSEIDGIGTVFEQRLFEYGIGTYWEVAHMSDEEMSKGLKLDEIAKASKTGSKMLKIDMGAIRADALRLAKETGTEGRSWLGGNPDDFEPIDGIGHVFELRLYDAGICTYEALIKAGVARLAEVCQPPTSKRPVRFKAPDYEGWIEQAIEFMNKKNKGS